MNSQEVSYTTHTYTIINEKELFELYKTYISKFFAYIKKLKPKPTLKRCGSYLLEYQYNWFELIKNILQNQKVNINNNTVNKYTVTYEEMMNVYNLPITDIQDNQYYKNIWGPVYWNFLHLTSIFCKTEYQKDLFCTNMLNFNLCMICSECAFNFKAKKPFMLMMIMSLSNDTITPLFNLHNVVNKCINHSEYSFDTFLEKYQLKITHSVTHKYTLITK